MRRDLRKNRSRLDACRNEDADCGVDRSGDDHPEGGRVAAGTAGAAEILQNVWIFVDRMFDPPNTLPQTERFVLTTSGAPTKQAEQAESEERESHRLGYRHTEDQSHQPAKRRRTNDAESEQGHVLGQPRPERQRGPCVIGGFAHMGNISQQLGVVCPFPRTRRPT